MAQKFELPELNKDNVRLKDKTIVLNKIERIINDGKEKLQVITDFDRTVSKYHNNGQPNKSSYAVYQSVSSVPKEFVEKSTNLSKKYRAIEEDPNMSIEEKIPYMEEWWTLLEKLFIGLPYDNKEIEQAIIDSKVAVRDGTEKALFKLNELNVPVLVFSAGLGNIIQAILEHYKIKYNNMHVISNFFKTEQGIVVGFEGNRLLHVFNKNQHAIEGTEYFKELKPRENVILLGDSLGDAGMSDGVQSEGCILKIGFLSVSIEKFLPQYLEKFDIVLLDDQTMDVFNAILSKFI